MNAEKRNLRLHQFVTATPACLPLQPEPVQQALASITAIIRSPSQTHKPAASLDASKLSPNDIRAWLRYDDLWYPAADDVVQEDESSTWLLLLDHEERFYRFSH